MKNIGKYRFYVLAAAFLWGCVGIYFRELSDMGIDPLPLIFIRTSVATFGLSIWFILKDRNAFRIRLKDLWCFLGTGIISLLMHNIFYIRAIGEVGLAIAGVLLYTAPAFVTIISAILFKEKLKLFGWFILCFVILGCAFVSGVIGNKSGINVPGILFGLGAGFGYALYSIFGRYAFNKGYSAQTITFYTFAICTVGCITLAFSTGAEFSLPTHEPRFWLLSATLGTFGCLFPYWLYTKGLSGLTGASASITATFEPVVAVLFGMILYNEYLSVWQIAGIIFVLGGIIILAKINSPQKQENSE